MNTLERKVSDLLRSYGEGLEMTTQDIDRLEQELEPKQKAARTRRRNTIWQGAVAACAVTGVVLGALALQSREPQPTPQPAGSPGLTTKDLAGVWSFDSWLWTFTEDGRLRASDSTYDPLRHKDSSQIEFLTYRITPGGFITHGADTCDTVWAATISPDGVMRATETGSTGPGCPAQETTTPSEPSDTVAFTRVSPTSAAGAKLPLLWPTAAPAKVTDVGKVVGTWLFPGTGTLLSVSDSGDYAVRTFDTLNQPETGTVTARSGSLAFTPADDPTCTAVYAAVSRNATLDAIPAADSCGGLPGVTSTWTRIN